MTDPVTEVYFFWAFNLLLSGRDFLLVVCNISINSGIPTASPFCKGGLRGIFQRPALLSVALICKEMPQPDSVEDVDAFGEDK